MKTLFGDGFVFGFKTKASSEDIHKYGIDLATFALNNELSLENIASLVKFAESNKFTQEQLSEAQEKACKNLLYCILKDGIMDKNERDSFLSLLKLCTGLSKDEREYWVNEINKYSLIYDILEKNILPKYDMSEVNIIYKKNEMLHFASFASIMKKKKVTSRISYKGTTASIRICKGLRYRMGSIQTYRDVHEYWDIEDSGIFWITNLRIGYIGQAKHFSFSLPKLLSISAGEGGMNLFKEGRSNPFIVSMMEYEIPCAIISALLNDDNKEN